MHGACEVVRGLLDRGLREEDAEGRRLLGGEGTVERRIREVREVEEVELVRLRLAYVV